MPVVESRLCPNTRWTSGNCAPRESILRARLWRSIWGVTDSSRRARSSRYSLRVISRSSFASARNCWAARCQPQPQHLRLLKAELGTRWSMVELLAAGLPVVTPPEKSACAKVLSSRNGTPRGLSQPAAGAHAPHQVGTHPAAVRRDGQVCHRAASGYRRDGGDSAAVYAQRRAAPDV